MLEEGLDFFGGGGGFSTVRIQVTCGILYVSGDHQLLRTPCLIEYLTAVFPSDGSDSTRNINDTIT